MRACDLCDSRWLALLPSLMFKNFGSGAVASAMESEIAKIAGPAPVLELRTCTANRHETSDIPLHVHLTALQATIRSLGLVPCRRDSFSYRVVISVASRVLATRNPMTASRKSAGFLSRVAERRS